MHANVIFAGTSDHDSSFALVFHPSPMWAQGNNYVVSLPCRPTYERGDLAPLLAHLGMSPADNGAPVLLALHPGGHGTPTDMAKLRDDLAAAGFDITTVDFSA